MVLGMLFGTRLSIVSMVLGMLFAPIGVAATDSSPSSFELFKSVAHDTSLLRSAAHGQLLGFFNPERQGFDSRPGCDHYCITSTCFALLAVRT